MLLPSNILSLLEKRIKEKSLPSSLLLSGLKKEINFHLVREFAKQLFGSSHAYKIDSGNHPDLHFYAPEEKSGLHSILAIRSLLREIAFPPFEAPYKLFAIDQADKMLPSSSNALLKTLEEPPKDTIIVLLTEQIEALLPTIRSRCTPFSSRSSSMHSLQLFDSLLSLAVSKDYGGLLQLLDQAQEEFAKLSIEELLEALFTSTAMYFPLRKIRSLLEETQLASQYNMKRRNLILHFFLKSMEFLDILR